MGYRWNEFLSTLVDQRLFAVEFVLDYVVLKFDNASGEEFPTLQCFVLPAVAIGDHTYLSTDTEWANALRSLIGAEVIATIEAPRSGLQIGLESGQITLRPMVSELVGPEIAMLRSGANDWAVWRPGEQAFENIV